ncbi:MAG: amidohydrolase, partial [Planctomycetes bacterium]|nr:amidohydrolase [Planctomycetota bacterium]
EGVRLRLLFQPAEESSEGARWLVDQGALEGVSAIVALHVDPEHPVGTAGIRYGVLTAYCDEMEIVVEGRGGHAARPHHTIDPVAAAAHLVGALYEFLPRRVDSRSAFVFTIGRISGGDAPNVIPERVEMVGTLRNVGRANREALQREVLRICAGAELSSGAKVRVRFFNPLEAVVNHPAVTAALEEAAGRVVGPENVYPIELPSMGGEDFSVYLERVPGAMLRLGCAAPQGESAFLHSPRFDLDERALALGTRILLRAALLLARSTEG